MLLDRRTLLHVPVPALAAVVLTPHRAAAAQASPRPVGFWTAIIDRDYAVPTGETPLALLLELGGHFGDRDPILRDRCGYGITARWVVREKRLTPPDLQRLASAWMDGLGAASDPAGGDPVLRRSFSALGLSLVAAADLEARALDAPTRDALLTRACAQLRENTDRRGFEPGLGWVHVTAHTADLVKFLARHPGLTAAHQGLVLEALATVVFASPVFVWGEDERLSRAAASVLRRDDAADPAVGAFLDRLGTAGQGLDWEQPLGGRGLAPLLNARAVLKDLHLVLHAGGQTAMRDRVMKVLQALA